MVPLTSTQVLARIIVTDGRYEKWQELFLKELKAASDNQWEDRGWSEVESDQALSFFHAKMRTTVVIRFTTTMSGNYDFAYALTQRSSEKPVRIALAKGVSGRAPVANTGKELIGLIVNALGLGAETVAASALKAAIAAAGPKYATFEALFKAAGHPVVPTRGGFKFKTKVANVGALAKKLLSLGAGRQSDTSWFPATAEDFGDEEAGDYYLDIVTGEGTYEFSISADGQTVNTVVM